MTNLWAFLFVLGVLVFVHELGHFLRARRNGVRVLRFARLRPQMLKFTRGGTEYCIGAIPLGGYVKMAGENPDDPRQGAPDEFLSKTKWQRFQVLIAGPLMNLLLAVVLMTFVIWNGATEPASSSGPRWSAVSCRDRPQRRPASSRATSSWPLPTRTSTPGRACRCASCRAPTVRCRSWCVAATSEQQFSIAPEAQTKYEIGDLGIAPSVTPRSRRCSPGSAAAEVGLRVKDVIVSFNGADTTGFTLQQMISEIGKRAGQEVTLGLLRDGQRLDVQATPRDQGGVGRLGISLSPFETVTITPGFVQAMGMSVKQNWEWTAMIGEMLAGLFTAETSPRQLMGPLGIAEVAGGAAAIGWAALFGTMAMVSLNLGLLNLMPIPILDGAHHHPRHRGPRAPDFSMPRQGTHADGRLRRADAADGDGHLQRPPACRVVESSVEP